MEAVILLEFASEETGTRAGLLERIAPLAMSGAGRLSFVATEPQDDDKATAEVIAIGFKSAIAARETLSRWRSEAGFPPSVRTRLLQVEPIRSTEPLAMMFP